MCCKETCSAVQQCNAYTREHNTELQHKSKLCVVVNADVYILGLAADYDAGKEDSRQFAVWCCCSVNSNCLLC